MVDAVNTTGGITAQKPVSATAPVVDNAKKDTSSDIPTLIARFYDDPLAGVLITQQLDEQGQIVAQNPPGSVVAYLRNGLTIQGYSKQTVTA
jgi:hypothetical protein